MFVLVAGLAAFSQLGTGAAARDVCAIVFGVGAAFVLDEFALIFYLRDVYWSEEGRDSVDATILGAMIAGLTLVVSEPFGLDDPFTSHLSRSVFVLVIAQNAVFAVVTFLKAKPFCRLCCDRAPAGRLDRGDQAGQAHRPLGPLVLRAGEAETGGGTRP